MKTSPRKPTAFTLVELLVVIAIIGVLFSMLLPSLSASRRVAENLRCSATSRGAAVVMVNYFNDMKGFIPPLAPLNADGSKPAWSYYYGSWYSFIRPWATLGNPNGNGTYRNDDARLLCCPSRVRGTWTYGYPYFLYATPWNIRYRVAGDPTTSWRTEELRDHSNTGLFVDNGSNGDSIYWMSVSWYSQAEYISGGLTIYTPQHEAMGVGQTFLDGHAEFVQLTPQQNLDQTYGTNVKFVHRSFYGFAGASGYLSAYYKYSP